MDRVVHFEIPVSDMDAARRFYGDVFGWETAELGMGAAYIGATTTPVGPDFQPTSPGGINGALMPRPDDAPGPVLVMEVDSIEDSLAKAEAAGGEIVRPKTEVPGMGWYAYIGDTQGNVVGVWKSAPAA